MSRSSAIVAAAGLVALGSVTTWLLAAEFPGAPPAGHYLARDHADLTYDGPDAEARRLDALARARVRLSMSDPVRLDEVEAPGGPAFDDSPLVCRFLGDRPTGTSPKFDCVLDGGQVVRVKYGRNPEIQAEAAASRLLQALGFAADRVRIVPRVRCYGCPRYPFMTMRLLWATGLGAALPEQGYDSGYTDFEWPAVEWRFEAPAIETESIEGWAWFELEESQAPAADLDAFRLLAVFLAHWDNKSDNQRLVCLDVQGDGAAARCADPVLMMQDIGSTFGPMKANLGGWRAYPVWIDRRTCLVSMKALPFRGATFPDARISEAGRVQLARQLASIPIGDVRRMFEEARFPEYYSGTDDRQDVDAWTRTFRDRVDEIVGAGPCPQ